MTAFPLGHLASPARTHRAPGSDRAWRVLAIASMLLATAVTVAVAWGADYPSFPFDEIDQLQMSRLLAGADVPQVTGGGYFPLWSLLIAPLWWITSDPFAVYSGAIVIGIVVGLATIVPLAFLGRRFRLSVDQSVVAASVAVTMPSVTLQADYALSERLLYLTVALAVLAAWRLWESPSHLRGVVFGLAVAAMYLTHVRVLAIVLASGVWLILFALRNWRVAIISLVALVVFCATAHYVGRELNVALLGQFTQGENLLDTLRESRPGLILRSALGQAWTQIVGTFGLAAVGLVALVRWSWAELRRLRAGRATYVLAIVAAMFLLTTIKWASDYHLFTRPWRRIDTWLYGRYVDPVTVILVVVALAVIIRGIRRATVLWGGAVSLAVILPTVFWVALDAPTWAYRTPAHIAGVMPWWWLLPDSPPEGREIPALWNDGRFWIVASATTVVALAIVFLLRRFTVILTALFAVAFAAGTLVSDRASDEFRQLEGSPPAVTQELREALASVDSAAIAFDMGCSGNGARDAIALNYYGYWLLPHIVRTFDSNVGGDDADVVITCEETPPIDETGSTVPGLDFFGRSVVVRPGDVAEALTTQGLLP